MQPPHSSLAWCFGDVVASGQGAELIVLELQAAGLELIDKRNRC